MDLITPGLIGEGQNIRNTIDPTVALIKGPDGPIIDEAYDYFESGPIDSGLLYGYSDNVSDIFFGNEPDRIVSDDYTH